MSIFTSIKTKRPTKSKFDLSHERKMSGQMGKLYPILNQEIVPGDNFKINSEIFIRLAPMIAPIMHRVNCYTHFFFVPNRLVWNEWEDFITGGEDGSKKPVFPSINVGTAKIPYFAKGRLPDYFGIPISDGESVSTPTDISALPFRAYTFIYNEYFRDQNLESPIVFTKESGPVIDNDEADRLTTIRQRAWEKDYFTSALPTAQRGPESALPLDINYLQESEVYLANGNNPGSLDLYTEEQNGGADPSTLALGAPPSTGQARIENIESGSFTINDFRKANRLQEWLEKSARGGARYIEQILSHFDVKSSDKRLQRPEYIGGGKQPISISEVLNTTGQENASGDPQGNPQGEMAGHGISVGSRNRCSYRAEEHGYIIGIVSILPRTAYQNGLERHWKKFDKFDYLWPEFANLGEQEVLNQELFYNYNDTGLLNESVWAYQQRYAEYKYQQSSVHGDFRDNLSYWHMGRQFDTLPALNADFVSSNDITMDIFNLVDRTVDNLYIQVYNKVSAVRCLPYQSIPSL